MQIALSSCGQAGKPVDVWNNPQAYLAELVSGFNAPGFVVFDNVGDFREIDGILPLKTASTIVVTCNNMSRTTRNHEVLNVGPMTNTESSQLVCARLPSITSSDAGLLSRASSGFPILINLACDLLVGEPISMTDFCDLLATEAAELAEAEYTDAGEPKRLTVLIERSLDRIRDESPLAYELIVCVAFLDGGPAVELSFALEFVERAIEKSATQTGFLTALEVFQRHSIMELVDERVTMTPRTGDAEKYDTVLLGMHSVVQQIIQRLAGNRSQHYRRTAKHMLDVERRRLEELYEEEGLHRYFSEPLDESVPNVVAESTAAVYHQTFLAVRMRSALARLEIGLLEAIKVLKEHDNKRLGLVNILMFRHDLPVFVFDLDEKHRPKTGVVVELHGKRLPLLDASISRTHSYGDAVEPIFVPLIDAVTTRIRRSKTRVLEFSTPCTSVLITDVIPWGIPQRMARAKNVTPMVIFVGNLN